MVYYSIIYKPVSIWKETVVKIIHGKTACHTPNP